MPAASLRVLIVDDEPLARARVRRLLADVGGATVVGEAGSVPEAKTAVAALAPELLLLDIQMHDQDGFALLEALPEPKPLVVFVTAFDHYAVRAFEANAVDYLLKPFRAERLAAALERARRDLARPAEISERLAQMLSEVARLRAGGPATSAALERFSVRAGARQLILRSEEILWFGAEDKLVFAATKLGHHYVNFTLDQLEQRLDPARFQRVHRSAIVNLDHARSLHPAFAGTWRLRLDDDGRTEVPVSRNRARDLRARLGA
jgi:two-component system LytT family response regulator